MVRFRARLWRSFLVLRCTNKKSYPLLSKIIKSGVDMKESNSIFEAVIDASLDALKVMDISEVDADIAVCENLIEVFSTMHLGIDQETAKAIWILYSINYHKTTWAEGGESKDACFRAVLELAYVFFRAEEDEEGSVKSVSPKLVEALSNPDNDFSDIFEGMLEMSPKQQQFMIEYAKQVAKDKA